MIALQLLAFFGLSLFILMALGGATVHLVPGERRSYALVLSPLFGYVLLLLVGYYAVRTVLSLAWVLPLTLGVAAATVLAGVLRRRKGDLAAGVLPVRVSWSGRHPVRSALEALGLREHGAAWLIALAAMLLAALPLLSYGYSVPIGENWDPENYVPIAAYLQRVPVARIMEMPPNPLRDMNAFPPRIGMTLGFCLTQGTLGQLVGGWGALEAFAPTIALLYGLTALAWYALFRLGFGMSRRAGLLGSAFAVLSALTLWIAFFNFGMQMAAMPLVPLALTLWLLLLRRPSWRTVLPAGLSVAAMPVAYYPALTVFAPVALGVGLYELLRRWAGRPPEPSADTEEHPPKAEPRFSSGVHRALPALLAGLATAALSILLALGPILDYGQGFSFRYGQQMTTLGLFHFPSLAQVLGLEPFSRQPEALPTLWAGLVNGGLVLVLLAAWAVVWPRRTRWIWWAALLPALLYLAWLRGTFLAPAQALHLPADLLNRLRPYPYAFLKGAVFVVPLIWGAAVENWERFLRLLSRRAWRAGLIALLLLLLGLVLAADGRLLARYWGRPAHFDRQAMQVRSAVRLIPAGEEVYLSGRPERSRLTLGLFAYFLLEHPVQGRLSTAYGGYDRRLPGAEPRYALLDSRDDPFLLGFSPADSVWAGGGMILYRRSAEIVSFLDLREDAYRGREGGEIHTKEPLAERLLQSFGPYPGTPSLTLYLDAGRLSRQADLPGSAGRGALLLALASLDPETVSLYWSDGTIETCAIPAGVSTCRTRPHTLPGSVELRFPPGAKAGPCWAALVGPDGEPGSQGQTQEVAVWPQVDVQAATLEVQLAVRNAGGRPLRLALEVWENTFEGAHHYAWWGPLPLPASGTVRLQADLSTRTAQAWLEGKETAFAPHPGAEAWPEAADGPYFAALWVYYGGQVVEVLPVGRFDLLGGQVQALTAIRPGMRLFRPGSPVQRSGARFGPAIELAAHEHAVGPFSPGDTVLVALEWHALERVALDYSVSVQMLKDGRLWGQWDGPVGQWFPATSWQAGQFIRDDIPLRVKENTPPGRYRLIVAVYDPVTGARLPVRRADGQETGDFLDLGEIAIR